MMFDERDRVSESEEKKVGVRINERDQLEKGKREEKASMNERDELEVERSNR